ncbi:MAG TPA: hypothetical protein VFC41_06020, partial [Anaerovoracaceae bacterium]|nr:hypothetical protein [Anaerovoracaceae bacterium]
MKVPLKILKLLSILIIAVSLILFSVSFLMQDKVGSIILNSLNNNISTKLDVGSFKLSLLRRFPNASLELKNVLVHSSSGFNSEAFTGINTDTLLAARSVTFEFNITDIIKGNYNIDRIRARGGKINFYTDTAGLGNYDLSNKNKGPGGEDFTINLERINLNDINACYNNLATKLIITGIIKKSNFKSRISGDNIDFSARAETEINSFQLYNTRITKTISAGLDLTLNSTKSGIQFKKGSLVIENYDFSMDGFVSSDHMIDLNISCQKIDIAKIRNYLPEKYLKLAADYDPSGILVVDCKIKGLLTRTTNPHIEINFLLNNGHVAYKESDLNINDLSFSGNFSNGSKNHPETSSVTIKDLRAKLGSSEYTGSVKFSGFVKPRTELKLKGRLFPGELREFFNLRDISVADGSIDIDLQLATYFWPKDKITINDIIDLKPEADLVFNSFTIGLQNKKLLFSQVNGNLLVSDHIKARNFKFTYSGQEVKVDGEFRNLPEWLAGRPVQMKASADVSINRLNPEIFLKKSAGTITPDAQQAAISLPKGMALDINFKIDSLTFKTFSASNITGTLNYKTRQLTFTSLIMESLNGMISGNGFIVQNVSKSVIAKAVFNVTNIDVNKT